jgi:hypothetical protein
MKYQDRIKIFSQKQENQEISVAAKPVLYQNHDEQWS